MTILIPFPTLALSLYSIDYEKNLPPGLVNPAPPIPVEEADARDQPPFPPPNKYRDGRLIWVGSDKKVWRFSEKQNRWVFTGFEN